ncbi:MAG: sigma 54-interacting transcriptional regulator, partial [Methylococcales bacterium]|nr:sigma 54-interacting transcriptional regulator [Methylococcales bacterium]
MITDNQKTLICWIGRTDLRAQLESATIGIGPIAQAVTKRHFDQVELLYDYPEKEVQSFVEWLGEQTQASISLHHHPLTSPTEYGEIYQAVTAVVSQILKKQPSADLVFHLSPGTPAMASVWIILSKTRFPAELIESARGHGVKTVSVPFDISAEFLPDLLAKPDALLKQRAKEQAPESAQFGDIIYQSPEMQHVIQRAKKAAIRSIPILIEGESGTGKELLARAIHEHSPRREKPMVVVNCGAISVELVES